MRSLRSTTLRRYRIDGRIPSPHDEGFHKALTDRRFLPLGTLEERCYGWVSAQNLLETRFDVDTVIRGEHAVVGLRIDRRRVNARLLRAHVDLEVRARLAALRDGGRPARLGREERQELRTDLHRELLGRTNPSVEAHTLLLHPHRKTLLFTSLARPANEVLRTLFRDTFGADLVPLTPWRRGAEILAGRPQAADLDALERTDFGWARVPPAAARPAPEGVR